MDWTRLKFPLAVGRNTVVHRVSRDGKPMTPITIVVGAVCTCHDQRAKPENRDGEWFASCSVTGELLRLYSTT